MNDVVLVQILETHEDLTEIGSGDGEVHGCWEVVGRGVWRRKIEEDAAWAVFEDLRKQQRETRDREEFQDMVGR